LGRTHIYLSPMSSISFGSWDDWGPEQDQQTKAAIAFYLETEMDLDYIIFSGDQITGENINKNASLYYQMIGDWVDDYGAPWGAIFGNHDTAG
jgi:hypothetical protein